MWIFNKEKFLEWVSKQKGDKDFSNYTSELHRLEGKTIDECFAMGYIINEKWMVFQEKDNGDA